MTAKMLRQKEKEAEGRCVELELIAEPFQFSAGQPFLK